MRTKQELLSLLNHNLTHQEEMGKRSAIARGLPYYGYLKSEYPQHFSSFSRMHARTLVSGKDCDFPRNAEGFISFLLYLGDIPEGMISPTLGRKDHSKGYVIGNFAWEERSLNCSKAGSATFDNLTQETIDKRRNTFLSNKRKSIANCESVKEYLDKYILCSVNSLLVIMGRRDRISLLQTIFRCNSLLNTNYNIIHIEGKEFFVNNGDVV